MTDIPKQLQDISFRFIKVRSKTKRAFENGWHKTANYTYKELKDWLAEGNNYGVIGGHGNLLIIDADTSEMINVLEKRFPKTFTVTTGKGKHYYYNCEGWEKKQILYHPTKLDKDGEQEHLGEVQWNLQYVVGPGSIHPSGKVYKANETKITKLDIDLAHDVLGRYKKIKKEKVSDSEKKKAVLIDILDVVDVNGFEQSGDEYHGTHPGHGSSNGNNFFVNAKKGEWHCYRHNTGGGVLNLIAMKEGLMKCGDCIPGALKGVTFKKLAKIVKEKYKIDIMDNGAKNTPEDMELLNKYEVIEKRRSGGIKVWCPRLAELIIKEYDHHFISIIDGNTDKIDIYYYIDGYYKSGGALIIKQIVSKVLGPLTSINRKNEVVDYVKHLTMKDRADMEQPPYLLNVKNGILDVRNGTLRPHTPDEMFIQQIPHNYNSKAKCPNILKFMGEVLYPEYLEIMQEVFGFCLYRKYFLHKCIVFNGGGRNGKGVMVNLLRQMLGYGNYTAIKIHKLMENTFSTSNLYGKLANIGAEMSYEEFKRTGDFKNLTGGEPIEGERKYHGSFEFVNYAKMIFNANDIPYTHDKSTGFYERWLIITFPYSFIGKKADAMLIDKLTGNKDEMEGLLAWAVLGLQKLLKNEKFTTVELDIDDDEDDDDGYAYEKIKYADKNWIMKNLEYGSYDEILVKTEVYDRYVKDMKAHRYPIQTITKLTQLVKYNIQGCTTYRTRMNGKRIHCYKNIRWIEDTKSQRNQKIDEFKSMDSKTKSMDSKVQSCASCDSKYECSEGTLCKHGTPRTEQWKREVNSKNEDK